MCPMSLLLFYECGTERGVVRKVGCDFLRHPYLVNRGTMQEVGDAGLMTYQNNIPFSDLSLSVNPCRQAKSHAVLRYTGYFKAIWSYSHEDQREGWGFWHIRRVTTQ